MGKPVFGTAMQELKQTALGILAIFGTPSSSVYWLYLASAVVLAALVHRTTGAARGERPTAGRMVRFLFPAEVFLRRSVAHDAGIFVLNTLLYSFVLLGPMTALSAWASQASWQGLYDLFGPTRAPWEGMLAKLAVTAGVFVVADLAFFVWHYLSHRIGVLWEFHKVHHSAAVLCPLTVFRRHPVDVVVERAIASVLVGGAMGAFGWLGAADVDVLTLLGVNVCLFAFMIAGFNLQHSHVWWSWGRRAEHLLVSPALHQIHHSAEARHHDKNFGNFLAVWDWLAGTLYVPTGRERFELGLGAEQPQYGTLSRLYFLPFYKAVRRVVRRDCPNTRPLSPVAGEMR